LTWVLNSGRHRCLWCEIPSDALKTPREERGRHTARTLERIKSDYSEFLSSGGNVKNAKKFNNVMGEHFMEVALDQVGNTAIT
jgi:CRISPR/Cas system-associated protein Cas10 (large subunit of type III CRISPR-Cas system)